MRTVIDLNFKIGGGYEFAIYFAFLLLNLFSFFCEKGWRGMSFSSIYT